MADDRVEFPDDDANTSDRARSAEEKREKRKEEAEALARLDPPTVYEVISRHGIEEMERPAVSLWWSGVAAGMGISVSLYVMAALRVALDGVPGAPVLEKFGYCVGFLIVVLSRLQLFTENTITPVLPVLRNRSAEAFWCIARLWSIVFVANLAGTFFSACLPILLPIATESQSAAVLDISMHFAERAPLHGFLSGVPAGFLVAAMVWMMPSSKGFEFWTIVVMTFTIAVADTSHVIVGSTELFTALLSGEIGLASLLTLLVCTGAGNIVGGAGLFAVLAYAQVSEEI